MILIYLLFILYIFYGFIFVPRTSVLSTQAMLDAKYRHQINLKIIDDVIGERWSHDCAEKVNKTRQVCSYLVFC